MEQIKLIKDTQEENGDTVLTFEVPYDIFLSLKEIYGDNFESIISDKFVEYIDMLEAMNEEERNNYIRGNL